MYYLDDPNAPRTNSTIFHLGNGVVEARFKVHFRHASHIDAHQTGGPGAFPTTLYRIGDYGIHAVDWATAMAIADELAANGIQPVRS